MLTDWTQISMAARWDAIAHISSSEEEKGKGKKIWLGGVKRRPLTTI
jgi:hypothetical protein